MIKKALEEKAQLSPKKNKLT